MRFPSKAAATLLLLALLAARAQDADEKKRTQPKIPVAEWLRGPDRSDFKWKVELVPPRMTYQQRHLVQVRAYLDVEPLAGGEPRDFYFLLKVADEKGNWLPGETYNHYPLPPGIDKKNEIQYSTGLYAKPGHYTVALILYDAVKGQGNVWRRRFEVKKPKKDPLPGLDRDIPTIEFIEEVPSGAMPTTDRSVFFPRRRIMPNFTDAEWAPGHGAEFLPVRPPRPLRVDVVLNFAPHIDPYMRARTTAPQYRSVTGRMLHIGAVLSHLSVDHGCVRIGGIDLSKLNVVFDRLDAGAADWDKVVDEVRKIDHNTVSVDVLGNRKSTAGFLRDYLNGVTTDSSGCGPGREKVERAVLLVSHDFQFPSGTHGDRLWPDAQCACRYYHVRIDSAGSDDLEKFLKPVSPRRLDFHDPEQFRRALAELIEDLSGGRERAREAAREN